MAKKIFTDESLSTLVSEIKAYISNAVSKKADSSHKHNDIYYTETEVDAKIEEVKADISDMGVVVLAEAQEYVGAHATQVQIVTWESDD